MSGPSWLGLLKWSLQQQDVAPSEGVHEMSEEDRQWLKEALQNLVRDDVERLTQINAELKKVFENDANVDYASLIDELRDITEQIDMATIFVRIGGVRNLIGVLTSDSNAVSEEARAEAAAALSTLAQNNAETQHMLVNNTLRRKKSDDESKSGEEIVEGGVIAVLQRAFFATNSATIRTRIVQALSAIVRGQSEYEERLCADDETIRILHASVSDNEHPRLQSKAAFVSKALLLSDGCTATRVLRLLPVAQQAMALITSEDADLREQAQSLLLAICRRGAARHVLRLVGEAEAQQQLARAEEQAQTELNALAEGEDRTLLEGYLQLVGELRTALLNPPPAASSDAATAPAAAAAAAASAASSREEAADGADAEEKSPVLLIQNPGPAAAPPGP